MNICITTNINIFERPGEGKFDVMTSKICKTCTKHIINSKGIYYDF